LRTFLQHYLMIMRSDWRQTLGLFKHFLELTQQFRKIRVMTGFS
jgi:hypothetical protein